MAGKDFSRFLKRPRGGSRLVEEAKAKAAAEKAARQGSESFNPLEVKPVLSDRDKLSSVLQGSKNKKALSEGFSKDNPVQAPYVVTDQDRAAVEQIFKHVRDEARTPNYPPSQNPVFKPANDKETKEMVPQRSVAGDLPRKPTLDEKLPVNDRARPILENENLIGQRLAQRLGEDTQEPTQFYGTSPVLIGLMEKAGLSFEEAIGFMREWSLYGAATSPRTDTAQNLRNASYLMYRDAIGDPLTRGKQLDERDSMMFGFPPDHNYRKPKPGTEETGAGPLMNRPGFRMMGGHAGLADDFKHGRIDPKNNPKPYTFRENWAGNMADATADTHNIRMILSVLDELNPGGVPRGWFKTSPAYESYVDRGGWNGGAIRPGDIADGLKGSTVKGQFDRTEYPIIQGPTNAAAEIMGLSPAQVQERGWFTYGDKTGLQSARVPISGLLNSQIEETGRALGMSPEDILKMWGRRRIPLAENEPLNIPGESAVG